jgi:hypothetical protein
MLSVFLNSPLILRGAVYPSPSHVINHIMSFPFC